MEEYSEQKYEVKPETMESEWKPKIESKEEADIKVGPFEKIPFGEYHEEADDEKLDTKQLAQKRKYAMHWT